MFENIVVFNLLWLLPVPIGGNLDTVTPRRKSGLSGLGGYCEKSKIPRNYYITLTGEQTVCIRVK